MTIHDAETAAVELLTRQLGADPDPRNLPVLGRPNEHTIGTWTAETASATAFDDAIGDTYFKVHREVWGALAHPRPQQIDKAVRIDRVLTPTSALVRAGWGHGVIGVELKRSGERIGPALAQAMDYGRSIWTLEPGNMRVWLDWVFVWPMPKQSGALASILAQNRIGSATPSYSGGVHFKSGESVILYLERDGQLTIGACNNGTKAGRR